MTGLPANSQQIPPNLFKTSDGVTFDVTKDIWRTRGIQKSQISDFRRFDCLLSKDLTNNLKTVLALSAPQLSSVLVHDTINSVLFFLRAHGQEEINIIDEACILTWRAITLEFPTNPEHWRRLRPLLKRWADLKIPGVTLEAVKIISKIRIKQRPLGVAIRTADSKKGPFTDIEMQAMVAAIRTGHADGIISNEEFALIWLFMALGSRPIQFAAMKISDLLVETCDDGTGAYFIRVPRAKQRNCGLRDQFKTRALVREIGEVVRHHIEQQKVRWTGHIIELGDAPFFGHPGIENDVLAHHTRAPILQQKIATVIGRLKVQSERTGGQLKVSARRFRYTKGTKLAAAGASPLVIAEALDHNDTASAMCYIDATPAVLSRLDRALALQLAPMAQAFLGHLVDYAEDADRGGDPTATIRLADSPPVGSCGSFGFCGAMAPIACYTCRSFQPWLRGPHEDVLTTLLAERERLLASSGEVMASINDRTILACAEVVRLCSERNVQDGNNG